jgi:hypothetical protein
MIYKVTQEDIRKTNDNIDAIEAFAACTSRELKYVFLTYDFGTPFRQQKFADRRLNAAIEAGYRMEKTRKNMPDKTTRKLLNGQFPKVEEAIVAFKHLRRDIDREALESYDAQLDEINTRLAKKKETDKDWDIAIKLVDKLPKLLKTRKDMIELLDLRADFKDEITGKIKEEEQEKAEISTLQLRNLKKIEKLEGKAK